MTAIPKLKPVLGAAALAAIMMALPSITAASPAAADVGVAVVIGAPYAPPPARSERRPHRPKTHFVWVDGRWDWHEGQWVWINGAWMAPPRGHHRWKRGHWQHRDDNRTWVWIEGRWY